jgi:hypothetical protein
MTTTSTAAVGSAPAPAGLLARFVGIITSPKATFQGIAAHPRWFWMFVVTTLITVVCTAGPMFTEWGRQAALDQQVRMMESFGRTINDEAYAAMERGMSFAAYTSGIGILVFAPLMLLVISGIFYAVFTAALGGNATFKQLVSVIVHAGVIGALAQLFALPMNYARGSMSSSTNLAVLLPMLDESSFLAGFLGAIDLFMVWYCLVLAIGLAVLYKRRTQPIAIGLFVVYAVIAIAIGLVKSSFGGSN